MIIDIHTHTFPDKIAGKALKKLQGNCHTALFSDGTAAGLRKTEAAAGVDLAVIQPVATYPEQVVPINNHVLEDFAGQSGKPAERPDGLLSFAAMHPAFDGWESELERVATAGIRGIKLHPPYEEVGIDDPRSLRLLKKCRDLGLLVLIHGGWDIGLPHHDEALPARVRRALDAVGSVRMIGAHMAGWKCWEEAASLLADTGIYLDTSFSLGRLSPAADGFPWDESGLQLLSESAFCDLVRCFGADHVLFGTDSPWADPAEELRKIRALPLSREDVAMICGENARKLLRLEPDAAYESA